MHVCVCVSIIFCFYYDQILFSSLLTLLLKCFDDKVSSVCCLYSGICASFYWSTTYVTIFSGTQHLLLSMDEILPRFFVICRMFSTFSSFIQFSGVLSHRFITILLALSPLSAYIACFVGGAAVVALGCIIRIFLAFIVANNLWLWWFVMVVIKWVTICFALIRIRRILGFGTNVTSQFTKDISDPFACIVHNILHTYYS